MADKIIIYSDGGSDPNPGIGGWAAVLRSGRHEKVLSGNDPNATNNRMELQAAIEGLKALKERCQVDLTTDSVYVKNGITTWLEGWKKKGWKTAGRKPVKNVDLWQALDEQNQRHDVEWHWVKGHSGHRENELADQLANKGIDEL